MQQLLAVVTSKKFIGWVSLTLIAAAFFIYSMDRWIMPAYTNFNEGITVPDVTKMSLDEAEALLLSYGLRYEIHDRRAHSAYPANYITDQSPAPRQIVKPNRKIYLTVNTEARPTAVVPDVRNLSLRNAEIQLENSGLTRGTISYESSRFRNTVMRQSLAPGDTVDQGATVDLAVSDGLGEEMVNVPDIVGLSYSDAQLEIHRAGLRIGEVRYEPSEDVTPNTVLSFTPEVEELREGEVLSLVISERHELEEADEAGAVIDTTEIDNIDEIDEEQ